MSVQLITNVFRGGLRLPERRCKRGAVGKRSKSKRDDDNAGTQPRSRPEDYLSCCNPINSAENLEEGARPHIPAAQIALRSAATDVAKLAGDKTRNEVERHEAARTLANRTVVMTESPRIAAVIATSERQLTASSQTCPARLRENAPSLPMLYPYQKDRFFCCVGRSDSQFQPAEIRFESHY